MTDAAHAIATARLELRPARAEDADALLGMRDPEATPDPGREERVRALVERNPAQFAACGFGLWLVCEGVHGVGYVGLRPRESALEPELYYGLAPAARGRGLATEAVRAVLARLFAAPEVTGAWAVTDPPNLDSAAVLARLGMRLEFTGEFDGKPSHLYRLRRAEWAAAPR